MRRSGFRLGHAIAVLVAAMAAMGSAPTLAEDPQHGPITVIVPYPAGGLGDLIARRLSAGVSERLKQQIIVDYKPGGGGTIGAAYVKTQPADGHTLLIANASIMAVNPILLPNVPFDAIKDFAPVSMLVSTSHVLLVPKDSPFRSVDDFFAHARAKKGALTFASSGIGGGGHLLGEMVKQRTGGNLIHVPYKGAAPAMQDLLGGQIDFYFESVALAVPHVQSGRVRPLAVTSQKRLAAYPDVPTMTELGHDGISADSWFGLFTPAGTSDDTIRRLNAAFVGTLRDPDVASVLAAQGLEVLPSTPEELGSTLKTDTDRYRTLLTAIGHKADE
jgi:tripartite-type tricarboxylate transporter receptor subunit TctC